MADEKLERIYTVPLGDAYEYKRTNRVPRAVKLLRQFVSRHMKTELDSVLISTELNNLLWARSIQKPPRRVKVRVIRQAGVTNVYLPDEMTAEEKKARKEKEDKAKKEAEEKAKKEKEAAKPAAAKPAPAAPAQGQKPAAAPASTKPSAPATSAPASQKPAASSPSGQKK